MLPNEIPCPFEIRIESFVALMLKFCNSFVGSASASSTREERLVVIVPPASVTSRSVPLSTTPVFNSFVGSASASSINEARSTEAEFPPSIYTVAAVPFSTTESMF